MTQITGPACQTCGGTSQTTTYDSNGNRDLVTDFNGNITDYDYDLTRNLEISRIEAKGTAQERTILTQWHPDYRLKTCTIEPSRTVMLDYYTDAMLQTRTEVDTSNTGLFPDAASKTCDAIKARADFATLNTRAWTYTYNANNQMETVDGPRTDVNDTTTYTYDPVNGNLLSVTNAAGHTTQITAHDASGRPLRMVDANGLVTQITYTPRGWTDLIKVGTDTVFETTDLDYDGVGQLIKVTLPDGSYLAYDYDAAHRLTDIRDQQGNHIHYTLDAMGNRTAIQVKDPNAVLTRTQSNLFNTLNQLSQRTGADKGVDTQISHYDEYDANGNLKQTRDAQGNTTQYSYDAFDRLDSVIDALNGTTSYTYDAMGNLATVTDPRNNTTAYQYDGIGNLTQLDSPDTGITQYTAYDAAGNLNSQTDARNKTTVYQYDALNRLTQITYDDGSTVVYGYDAGQNASGRLSSITDASAVISYAYDLHGRITSKTQTIDTVSLPVVYRYNAQGQLAQMTYPSGKVIAYTYSNGKIASVSVDGEAIISGISYDPFGPANAWTWGNGTAYSRSYDLDGLLDTYPFQASSNDLDYDNTGNLRAITDINNPTQPQTFDYDALYRLTDYSGLGEQQTYGYDANGNRTFMSVDANTYGYSVDPLSNRLDSVAGPSAKSYQYDLVGNIINDGTHSYQYDDRNRLIGVGTTANYTLNGLGQRVAKTANGEQTLFVYDEAGQLIAEADQTGAVLREYVYLGNQPIAVLTNDNQSSQVTVNFNDYTVLSYGGGQDVSGNVTVEDNGASLRVTGNLWKKVNLPYTITPNTVLEFDFRSSAQGEIHGIGFDIDNSISSDRTFKLYGTQVWGIAAYDDYAGGGQTTHYRIPVGQYYTGDVQNLFFANDHDVSNPTAESVFSNIRVYEDNNGQAMTNFNDHAVLSYGGGQDVSGNVTIEDNGASLNMTGNLWKKINLPYTITLNTVLEFDFRSSAQGEIHGIGFDIDNALSANRTFKLYGTQAWGIAAYDDYAGGGQTTHYRIPVGQYYTGDVQNLFFANDHDVGNPTAQSVFSNIQIYEDDGSSSGAGNSVYYIQTDHLNTARAITDTTNTVVWSWLSDPFGSTAANDDPDGDGSTFTYNLRFPGQYYDEETGLHYNTTRDYDPQTGRYIQSDSIGLAGGLNTYAYVGGNPLSYVDPTGEFLIAIPIVEGIGGVVTHVVGATVAGGIIAYNVSDDSSSEDAAARDCPGTPSGDPDCEQINREVQDAKREFRKFKGIGAACRAGMSQWELSIRKQAWLRLARARSKSIERCWNGGDEPHQDETAKAWTHVQQCDGLI